MWFALWSLVLTCTFGCLPKFCPSVCLTVCHISWKIRPFLILIKFSSLFTVLDFLVVENGHSFSLKSSDILLSIFCGSWGVGVKHEKKNGKLFRLLRTVSVTEIVVIDHPT